MEQSEKFKEIQKQLTDLGKKLNQSLKEIIENHKNIQAQYEKAHAEIMKGENLEAWDTELTETLKVIEHYLKNDSGYDKLRNELFYLKYLIAEKKGL